MITKNSLPKSYVPYGSLIVCSNSLLGGGHIVSIGDVLPIIIGKGEKPMIWLQALTKPESKEFVTIVEGSISQHPAVKIYEENDVLKVSVSGTTVLSVKATAESSADVNELDLRPLGLNLHGDSSTLMVGTSIFSGNSMSGGGILIGFSGWLL
ncbi:MAG: hypothetical protein Q8P51_13670 [Ignavibacteria bacterium]|nr:hypothetical protein [Ignavibacteria bacterium]